MSPYEPYGFGGDERVRTDDPLLAKQVLSQLSYTPMIGSYTPWRSLTPYRTSKIKQRLAILPFTHFHALTLKYETFCCFMSP